MGGGGVPHVTIYGIILLIYLSDSSLLVYRNTNDFCILTFYSETLLNLFSSISILVEFLRFSTDNIMSSANNDDLSSSFLIWMPFISLSWLIGLVRTSSKTLRKSSKSGHPCLFPDVERKFFGFSTLGPILTVGLLYMDFVMLRYLASMPNLLKCFNHKRKLNFVKCFFFFYWDSHIIFILHFVNVVYNTDWFGDGETS